MSKKTKVWNKGNLYKGKGQKKTKLQEIKQNAVLTSQSKKEMKKGLDRASYEKKVRDYAKKHKITIAKATIELMM